MDHTHRFCSEGGKVVTCLIYFRKQKQGNKVKKKKMSRDIQQRGTKLPVITNIMHSRSVIDTSTAIIMVYRALYS